MSADDACDRPPRGISTIVGVVVLIGLTVVLAALFGTGVISFGSDRPADAPTGKIELDVDDGGDGTLATAPSDDACTGGDYDANDKLTITYVSGDKVDRENLVVVVGDTTAADSACPGGQTLHVIDSRPPVLTAGTELVYAEGTGNNAIQSGATVRLLWESPDGGEQHVIAEETIP